MSEQPPSGDSGLGALLRRAFFINTRTQAAGKANRRLYRGILEFLRNLIVVTFLYVLARKSGSWLLWGLWGFGGFALYGSVVSYWDTVAFNANIIERRWLRIVIEFAIFLLFFVVVLGFSVGMYAAVMEMGRVQMGQ